ncbi:MAG: hypothetical protein AB7I38_06870 [Dehalococcoidia bacterium]
MRAVLVDSNAAGGLRIGEAAEPAPAPNQALVEVRHLSLNFGDLNGARTRPDRFIPGWDASGIVLRAAEVEGSPPAGARVVTTMLSQGGWAERRAVDFDELAVVPDDIDLGEAATLPVAGVTALRALRRSGALLGRRVLVTGRRVVSVTSRCSWRRWRGRTSSRAWGPRRAARGCANSAPTRS